MINHLLADLITLSRLYGADTTLVQGGGGNTSVKPDSTTMYIKASGSSLAQASADSFILVQRQDFLNLLREPQFRRLPNQARDTIFNQKITELSTRTGGRRPSIETFLHALLTDVFVIHLHPLFVNAATCGLNGFATTKHILEGKTDFLWVPYASPGYPLACALETALQQQHSAGLSIPPVILLQNHGIIFTGNSKIAIEQIFAVVMPCFQQYYGELKSAESTLQDEDSLEKVIADLQEATELCWQSAQSAELQVLAGKSTIDTGILYPELVVYCGVRPVVVSAKDSTDIIAAWKAEGAACGVLPRIMVLPGRGVLLAGTTAKEVQITAEVFAAHLQVLELLQRKDQPNYLSEEEIKYLASWESEKYRVGVIR